MTIIQAILLGILYYLSAGPWIIGIGFYTFGKPLVLGLFVGLILGDPVAGTKIGATIQLIYLGVMSTGGSFPQDAALAGVIGTAVALTAGLSVEEALAVAIPLGLIGTVFYQIRVSTNVIFSHLADQYATKGQVNKVWLANVLYPQILLAALYVIPCALACYYGVGFVEAAINELSGSTLLRVIGVIGGMLPALGIAMNMKAIFKGDARVFFFVGFMLAVYFKLDLIALGGFSIIFALLYIKLKYANIPITTVKEEAEEVVDAPGHKLSKKALRRCYVNWMFMAHGAYSYERLQGIGFLHAMCPVIDELYEKDDIAGRASAMQRHTAFFNTEPRLGCTIVGLTAAMEERVAAGDDELSGDAMGSIKYGMMGPVSGIGDTFMQAIIAPILLSMAIGLSQDGNIMGPILYTIVFIAIVSVLGWYCFRLGYRKGDEAILSFIESGVINRVIEGAGVLGCSIMGSLVANFVVLNTIINIKMPTGEFNLQANFFDKLMPCILPLALTLIVYKLLKKERLTPLKVMLLIVAAGLVLGFVGII